MIRLLFIGDIVGKPGRQAVAGLLPTLIATRQLDLVVANVENAAGGFGLTSEIYHEILDCGVDVCTSGNHIWDKREIVGSIGRLERLVRPANYPAGAPGRGRIVVRTPGGVKVGVVNVSGVVFMDPLLPPFERAMEEVRSCLEETPVVLVDFHAEATSEKVAFGWYADGKVSAVLGTHTHVQTADERILPGGAAYITDVGMTGPMDSVIGVRKEASIERFLTQMPNRYETAKENVKLCGVFLEIDEGSGRAASIERLQLSWPPD